MTIMERHAGVARAVCGAGLVVLAAACGGGSAAPTGGASGTGEALSVEDAAAIAEEGFVYGLPIVMNYAVMDEYALDPGSSQYKAPLNQIKHEQRVFTYRHGGPHLSGQGSWQPPALVEVT
jgi:hypothetical protein